MSSSKGNTNSQPDLSNITISDHELKNISIRKRKVPEDDFGQQFNDFKKEILDILKDFSKSQTENINLIRQDISSVKEQLIDIKATTNQLVKENNTIKSQIENLTSTVNCTQEKIKCLENDLNTLQTKQTNQPYHKYPGTSPDELLAEVQDRMERNRNIILAGVLEPHMNDMDKKREYDRSEAMKILRAINPHCPEPEKTIRLGKYGDNKTRPLKVCFSSQDQAKTILKNKSNLKDIKIKIYSDQTPLQQQNILNLREELQQRTDKGEKYLTIKYVKGYPKIVKQSKN